MLTEDTKTSEQNFIHPFFSHIGVKHSPN